MAVSPPATNMKLALRFSLAVTAGIGLILAAEGVLHVNRIAALQEAEIKEDVTTLGETLSNAVGEAWAMGGRPRALAFIGRVNDRGERTHMRLLPPEGVDDPSAPSAEPRAGLLSTEDDWHVVALAPVRSNGETVAVLEIERQLPKERKYFASILRTQVGTTIAASIVSGGIALAFGFWLIARPIGKLSELARGVADGDFSLRSDVNQDDEIGKLARELDAMTDRLAASHKRVRAERRARTEALEKLRHADRLSTVGRLASSMAHEIGTPLNIVSGRAMMIASDDAVPEEARQNARRIAEQAKRITGTIREILDFARQKTLERTETSIGDVLNDAVSLMEPILDDKGVAVEIEGSRKLVAPIDSGKILQVLTNLMMNAIHAMPGGGRITLRAGQRQVADPKDRHARGGDFVVIDVEDEGVGIPEDRLDDIFKAFFTTKKAGTGTGLGLSVCHGIVREHGGWIEVESEVGRRTCFRVYLPQEGEA